MVRHLTDLLATRPLFLSNIIYTFHDYETFAFTHQGAMWTDPHVAPLRSIPCPSRPDNIEGNLGQATSLSSEFSRRIRTRALGCLQSRSHLVFCKKRWSYAYKVSVYCGEFGVLRDYVTTLDACRVAA